MAPCQASCFLSIYFIVPIVENPTHKHLWLKIATHFNEISIHYSLSKAWEFIKWHEHRFLGRSCGPFHASIV